MTVILLHPSGIVLGDLSTYCCMTCDVVILYSVHLQTISVDDTSALSEACRLFSLYQLARFPPAARKSLK